MVPSVASSLSLAVKGGTERARAKQHRTLLEADSFSGWTCGSNLATSHGLKSCLENFGKRSLRELYAETYAHGEATPLHHASAALHRHLWNLCEPLDVPNHRGHTHAIRRWSLNGTEVCKKCWQRARGGSDSRIRTLLSECLNGRGPTGRNNARIAKLELALLKRSEDAENARQRFTANWWANELLVHQWLPSEQAVQFRGAGFKFVHKSCYIPEARKARIKPLSYRPWKKLAKAGVLELHAKGELAGSKPDRLRVKRSANHSNFPECDLCKSKRKRYLDAVHAPGADPMVVQKCKEEILEHRQEYTQDRQAALRCAISITLP